MKKLLKIVFGTILTFVVVCFAALFIFIKTFDLNKYKNQISEVVYKATGRELKLNGHAGIKISLIPTIELNDVAFSNASWAKEPNLLEVKNIDIAFSIMPLLEKEIVIDKVHLNEPKVYLSVNEKGVANWDFSEGNTKSEKENESKKEEALTTDVAQGAMLASVVAKSFKIENGLVIYDDLQTKSEHNLKINKIVLNSEGMDDNINADIDVVYNDEEVKANIVAGSINSVLQNAEKYPLNIKVKAYGATAQIDGALSDLSGELKYDFDVKATNPNGNFGAPAVNLNTKIVGDVKKINLDIISLNVAENEIKGTVFADLSGQKPYIKAAINSTLIDLNKFNQTKNAVSSFNIMPVAHAADFVPATPIDLRALNLLNADISADVKKVLVNTMSLSNIKSNITLNKGVATINIKELGIGDGNLTGSIVADSNNNFKADLTASDVVIQNFVTELVPSNKDLFGILSGGKTDLAIKLTGKGNDVRSIVERLNGQLVFIIGESKVQMGSLKYLNGDFVSQILKALNVKTSEKDLSMSCFVVRSDITDGNVSFPKGIAFKSNKITVVSDGSVNLKNDKINLSIKPFNGKISDANVAQVISSMLKVGGTIQKPNLTIDNSAVLTNVIGYAAAGPAFLGSQLLLDADDSPCYTALKGTSYEKMFPVPSAVKTTGQNIYQGANQAVNESINLVNGAAKGVVNLLKGKKK